MQSRSLGRELALLVLGQVPDTKKQDLTKISIEGLLNKALQSLMDHWRERLDNCATNLERAQQDLLDSELQTTDKVLFESTRSHLRDSLVSAELVLNGLSASLEFPRLFALSDQENIRLSALKRVGLVLEQRISIDSRLDSVMDGWRLRRLPRIDRDILRIAVVDLTVLQTPVAVACNEAVDLAHRYSDEKGRRMINGVLRRLQDSSDSSL